MVDPKDDAGGVDGLEEELRPSRTSLRRDRKASEAALAELAIQLCEMTERRIMLLELPESTLESVLAAKRIVSSGAKNRALRRVRQHLRDLDWRELVDRLDAKGLRRRGTAAPPRSPTEDWRERLIAEGDTAIDALLQEFPSADRQEVRVLVRNLRKAKPSAEPRARQVLDKFLLRLVRAKK